MSSNKSNPSESVPQSEDSAASQDVTLWVQAMQEGDEEATRRLFEHCFPRLLKYAQRRIPDRLRRALDEEDVALSAFQSFCSRAQRGSLADIQDRSSLWRLLMCLTKRKSAQHLRNESRQKRGGGRVRGESAFLDASGQVTDKRDGLANVAQHAVAAIDLESFQRHCCEMLDQLDSPELQTVALLRMEGYSIEEIAAKIPCAKRTVERRLHLIRTAWRET